LECTGAIVKEIKQIKLQMDVETRQKRIEGLNAIKGRALSMAKEGKDSFEVRNFVDEAQKELAYELPDEEAFKKAVNKRTKY
jgi:hypothetical protein